MPAPKRITAYGPEYELLLLRVVEVGTFHLPMPTEAHARTFRMKLYGYFSALRKENIRHDLIKHLDKFSLALDNAGILFYPKTDHWDAEAIRDGLGISKSDLPPPIPTAHSSLMQKLGEIRARAAQAEREQGSVPKASTGDSD